MIGVVLSTLLRNAPTSSAGASSYSIKIKKYDCIDTPYKESTLYTCKSIPRRNAPTMVNISINIHKIYDDVLVKVMLFYKFSTYQPFMISILGNGCEFIRHPPQVSVEKYVYDIINETLPELLVPCPTGNRIYNLSWYLQDRHAPKNIPPGDYKLQFKLIAQPDITLFGMEAYIAVRTVGVVLPFVNL
uniref:MD-2-related lipid-recognition domain-containing protein n=2 Tax=Anopheles stephensi TaxID=30069 RepID=A0A182Y1J0_ANOST